MAKKVDLKWSPGYPYNRYSDYLKAVFGKRMQKISIDAGFTCPNIDGTIGTGGCIYCNNKSFNPNYELRQTKSITQQIDENIPKFRKRNEPFGFLAYFQSHTNTHGSLEILKSIYNEALNHPQIEGIIISTRPDCLPDDLLGYLGDVNKSAFAGIEIGIESTKNETLQMLNRGHTWEQVVDAVHRVKKYGLHLGGHLILGLPGENRDDILTHAKKIGSLPVDAVKLHQLQIIKNTKLAKMYKTGELSVNLIDLDNYIELCIQFVEFLHPGQVVERFSSESKPELLEVKVWDGVRNFELAQRVAKEMVARDVCQGGKHAENSI